ncbi:glycosyltransferase family 4 protein [Cupriavidus pauculus]|uniref:glycosyltransferase family 4 protein n=1 Tax=Cupriavidus pauculus TaxID=82633 RepID=UPI001EE1EA13|nr:glycosyltransferase family 4 protein [Cupriavidus pauculus]GJG94629.1 glycosyltransferase family 4 protein [Cupriavidus pauculus]
MKHVWILNHYAQEPGSGPGGTRHYHLAEHLSASGWQATVIAANSVGTRERQQVTGKLSQLERIRDVAFLWVRTPQYEGNGVGRILNMLTYSWRALRRQTTRDLPRPDVVVGSSVHPFAAAAGALLAHRFKVPFVFEVRDLWPQTLVDMGRLREGDFLTWALRKLELWLYRRATRIVVLLPHAWEYIAPLGIPKAHIAWIPNGVDLSLFPPPTPARAVAPTEPFTLMYFGAHGQANGLENVLHAMKLVQDRPEGQHIILRMVGDGGLKPALMAQAQQLGLSNVIFEPPVPKTHIPTVAMEADAFVIAVRDLPQLYRYGISMNKLFDYLAAGRPIVMASSAANNPVADAAAGLTVAAEQPEALADAIIRIASTPLEARQRMGRAGREYVERHHSFQLLAQHLAGVLDEACRAQEDPVPHQHEQAV